MLFRSVTDHHAIIPTGVPAQGMTEMEAKVYDLVARRFIGAFYPDCQFETTTVLGKTADIGFKVTGKVITDPAWRIIWATSTSTADKSAESEAEGEKANSEEQGILPVFTKGESGPHVPDLAEKQRLPPNPTRKPPCCGRWRRQARGWRTRNCATR